MANLGDVTVALRADTAQFQAGMAQAAAATQQATATTQPLILSTAKLGLAMEELRRDVALMNAHLKSGVLSTQEYAASMAATRQQVLALGASMHNADAQGVRQFGQLLKDTAPAAEKAGLGIKSLREPLAALAAQSLGVSGRFGTLASVMLSIGAGSTVAVGVVGGLAAVAAAMNSLKDDTKEALRTWEEYLEGLAGDKSKLALVGAALDAARLRLAKLQELVRVSNARGEWGPDPKVTREITELQETIRGLETTERRVFTSLQTESHKTTETTREFRGEIRGVDDALKALNQSLDQYLARLKDPILFTKSSVLGLTRPTPAIPAGPDQSDLNALSRQLMDGLEPVLKAAEQRRRDLIQAGREIGSVIGDGISRGLARSLLGGVKDLADVLKNVFRAALEELLAYLIKATVLKAIANIIGAALGGPGGGGFLGGIVSGLGGALGLARGGGAVAGTGPNGWGGSAFARANITVPVSAIPRSPSPLVQARDAQWQTLFGETLRVMEGLGYRFQLG